MRIQEMEHGSVTTSSLTVLAVVQHVWHSLHDDTNLAFHLDERVCTIANVQVHAYLHAQWSAGYSDRDEMMRLQGKHAMCTWPGTRIYRVPACSGEFEFVTAIMAYCPVSWDHVPIKWNHHSNSMGARVVQFSAQLSWHGFLPTC